MEKYDIEHKPKVYWAENPDGYSIPSSDEIPEGISLEGLELRIIDTDNV
jgi:hypothetical protein